MEIKLKEKKSKYGTIKTLVYAGNNLIGYFWQEKEIYNYAFGSPSQSCVIAFEVDSKETAIKRLVESHRSFLLALAG